MKVLIVGGYSMLGYYLAQRFNKEAYDVTILDQNKSELFSVKHHGYKMKLTDKKCEWLFKNKGFDVVVYIDEESDKVYAIDGFIHMVELSAAYKVKSFIYFSHDRVTGYTGLNTEKKKKMMEAYCAEINKKELIHCIAIRTGMIYGIPYKIHKTHHAIQQLFQDWIFKEQIDESLELNAQYIYVEEVADAVCKAAQCETEGSIRLLDDEKVDAAYLIRQIKGISQSKENFKMEQANRANKEAEEKLHWHPKYTPYESLKKTVEGYEKLKKSVSDEVKNTKKRKSQNLILPYVENLMVFFLVFLLSYITRGQLARYSIFPLDFNVLYILIISLVYGGMQGILAAALSTFSYIYIYTCQDSVVLTMVYSRHHMMQLLIYFVIAIVGSYVVDNKKRKIGHLENALDQQEKNYRLLSRVNEETIKEKNQLYEQVLSADNNLGTIYELFKEINSLMLEDIFNGTIQIIERLMPGAKASIYVKNGKGDFLRLITKSRELKELDNTIDLTRQTELAKILQEKEIYINRKLKRGVPLMMAPITEDNEQAVVIFVHKMPFEKLTLHSENLFKVAISLIAQAIRRDLVYEEAIKEKKYVGQSYLMKQEYFEKLLASKEKARTFFNMDYLVLEVQRVQECSDVGSLEKCVTQADKISNHIRKIDYMGIGSNGRIHIVLSNADELTSLAAIERLKSCGIMVRIGENYETSNVVSN